MLGWVCHAVETLSNHSTRERKNERNRRRGLVQSAGSEARPSTYPAMLVRRNQTTQEKEKENRSKKINKTKKKNRHHPRTSQHLSK